MPKRSIGLTIFGAIFILLGIISAISPFIAYIKFSELGIMISAVDELMDIYTSPALKYFLIICLVLPLAGAVSYIITGIGILRLRYWGWYLAMAAAFSKLFSLANPGFIFGWQAIGLFPVVIQLGFLIFVFSFFRRRKIKEQFALNLNRFSFKSWYGAVVIFYLILPLVIPLTAIALKTSLKLKPAEPFWLKGLPKLELKEGIDNLAGAKRREIFKLSFLAPNSFVLETFNKELGMCVISDNSKDQKGFIMIHNKAAWDGAEFISLMKFKNAYEFEKAIHSNNWAIGLLILRNIATPAWDDGQILIFETDETKGFIRSGRPKDNMIYDYSIYDKSNQGIGNISLILNSKYFSKKDALKILSSLKILNKPQGPAEYYQNGLKYLNEGDMISAQMAFAQAYYLNPKNPEYAYSLARALPQDDERSLNLAKKMIEETLKLKPDYSEAQSLLEILNQENK